MEAKTEGQRQAEAARDELHRIILNALDYEREAFEEDTDVEGADLCEFFSEWRRRAEAALVTLATFGPSDSPPTVLVTMEGGLIQNIDANVTGLRVIVADFDIEGVEECRLVPNWDGDKATWVSWVPRADAELIEHAEGYVERGEKQIEAAEAAEKQRAAEKQAKLSKDPKAMLAALVKLAEHAANAVKERDARDPDAEADDGYEETEWEMTDDLARLLDGVDPEALVQFCMARAERAE